MSKAQHTQGQWVADGKYVGTETCSICDCYGYADSKQAKANARLIAAAPELLHALKGMLLRFGGAGDKPTPAEREALAAIAKAEGEEK